MQKFLITGLGNRGTFYENTRHNTGFKVLDYLAERYLGYFSSERFGHLLRLSHKDKLFILLKPDTFMNLSGKSVKYWMDKEKLSVNQLLVVTDDIHLELGILRLRPKGTHGGHNGLKNIQDVLSTSHYPRLRIGIGGCFEKGDRVDYVLGRWTQKELSLLTQILKNAADTIISFGMSDLSRTMNVFNKMLL